MLRIWKTRWQRLSHSGCQRPRVLVVAPVPHRASQLANVLGQPRSALVWMVGRGTRAKLLELRRARSPAAFACPNLLDRPLMQYPPVRQQPQSPRCATP
jgi:hypothetical protein